MRLAPRPRGAAATRKPTSSSAAFATQTTRQVGLTRSANQAGAQVIHFIEPRPSEAKGVAHRTGRFPQLVRPCASMIHHCNLFDVIGTSRARSTRDELPAPVNKAIAPVTVASDAAGKIRHKLAHLLGRMTFCGPQGFAKSSSEPIGFVYIPRMGRRIVRLIVVVALASIANVPDVRGADDVRARLDEATRLLNNQAAA